MKLDILIFLLGECINFSKFYIDHFTEKLPKHKHLQKLTKQFLGGGGKTNITW